MDTSLWLIVIAAVLVVLAIVFMLIRKHQRSGGVLASGPAAGRNDRPSQ